MDQSQIKMTPELEKAILEAVSVSEISKLMRDAAIEQHLVQPDSGDPFFLNPAAPGTADRAKKEVRIVNLNNKKYYLEAESGNAASLDRQEAALFRKIFAEAPANNQRRDANGKFVSDADVEAARAAEARAIEAAEETVAERLEREMVEKSLRRQGIDPEALREYSEVRNAEQFKDTWEAASEIFRNSALGSSWPGGSVNQQRIGEVIAELGLTEQPTAETLSKAYQVMRERGLVAVNEELQQEKNINSANSYEDLKRAIGYRGDSNLFGH